MMEAISSAAGKGLSAFSFLPSPSAQVGLVRFKEKWGGVSQETPVYDLYGNNIPSKVLKALIAVLGKYNRQS